MISESNQLPTGDEISEPDANLPDPAEKQEEICDFCKRFGFQDADKDLLFQAFVHRSYAFENNQIPDNERLEFLGDAVLGALAADFLYAHFANDTEGELSKKKAFLVSRKELSRRAEELDMARLIMLGKGEESSGGRRRVSVTGSALEAFVGALSLSLGIDRLKYFVFEHVLEPGLASLEAHSHPDYKSRLQEMVQKSHGKTPRYEMAGQWGPDHEKTFVVQVFVGDEMLGKAEGKRKKMAENLAARQAWKRLGREAQEEK
ncbi:MAG: ribonuclease III [Candidatus Sumerlaeia bacterium]